MNKIFTMRVDPKLLKMAKNLNIKIAKEFREWLQKEVNKKSLEKDLCPVCCKRLK